MDNVLNAEFLRDLSYMSKEEFINRVKTAENGATYTMQQGVSLDDLLKRIV